MKKKNRINGQITLSVFAISLVALSAAEQRAIQTENLSLNPQKTIAALAPSVVRLTKDDVINLLSQRMDARNKTNVIEALEKMNPEHYKDFIKIANVLLEGIDAENKSLVMWAIGKVNPGHYTAFIDTVNALSEGMNAREKWHVIYTLGCMNHDRYTELFIKTVNALSQGMDASDKTNVITTLGWINPNLYKESFINTVNVLSEEVNAREKWCFIQAVESVNPEHYLFLQNFIRQNPLYFTYVPANQFSDSITPDMTQQELQELLERLHSEYFNTTPAGTPEGLSFEIHNFANQNVVGETHTTPRFF